MPGRPRRRPGAFLFDRIPSSRLANLSFSRNWVRLQSATVRRSLPEGRASISAEDVTGVEFVLTGEPAVFSDSVGDGCETNETAGNAIQRRRHRPLSSPACASRGRGLAMPGHRPSTRSDGGSGSRKAGALWFEHVEAGSAHSLVEALFASIPRACGLDPDCRRDRRCLAR